LQTLLTTCAAIAGLLALAGVGYLLAVLWCVRRFATRAIAAPGFSPPVSILKPLKGADPQMYESFRSHCLQDYPDFEIIFGVNDADDPAVAEVERLRLEFPRIPMQLVVCSEVLGTNRKVSNLVRMLREARHEHVVINDSDIRVGPDYLRKVMAPFADPNVGLVSALYRAVAGRTVSSAIESLAISTEFAGGILMAINIEHGMHFALGSTLAVTKTSVGAIGGLKVLVDYLADDYELGNRIWQAGYKIELADTVVETFVPDYSFSGMFRHQLRWARTIRDRRSAQYLGLTIVYAVPWALIALLLSGGAMWGWTLLAVTLSVRLINAYVQAADVLNDSKAAGRIWLVSLRDCVALMIWAASFFGSTIAWRDEKFKLKDGKLYPLR
jgi:ceramide glucosyltransferase